MVLSIHHSNREFVDPELARCGCGCGRVVEIAS